MEFVKSGILKPASDRSHHRLNCVSIGPVGATLVELRGLEPLTPSVQRRCSPKLSYSPLRPTTVSYHRFHRTARLVRRPS
jgi:hypothetical protein